MKKELSKMDKMLFNHMTQRIIENPWLFYDFDLSRLPEEYQLKFLKNRWTKGMYFKIINYIPEKNRTEYFYKEVNRLKLLNGPLR